MKYLKISCLSFFALAMVNCANDDAPLTALADFQFLIQDTKVTFNGTVANANTIAWDFGDGNTSTDEDPIYIYENPGEYAVSLTVSGEHGTFTETKTVTIFPSFDILLTGGQGRPDGKSWKLKKAYTAGKEGAGFIANDLGLFIASFDNLLAAVGLGDAYEDTFTFVFDGTYKVDNKDGQSLMGILHASIFHGANITAVSADLTNVPLAYALYTPVSDATWELSEEDFTIATLDPAVGPVTRDFTGHKRLILGEYFGYKETSNYVIVKEITENTMNVALGIHTEQDFYDTPTLFFHLSFEAQ